MTHPTPIMDTVAKPLTDDERATIVDLLATGKSAREIATDTGRSVSTISTIAQSFGHDFGRSNLAQARRARTAYCAEVRAELAAEATVKARAALAELDRDQQVVVMRDGEAEVELVRPDARAWRDLAAAMGSLTKAVLEIDRHDNRADEGASAVDEWVRWMQGDE